MTSTDDTAFVAADAEGLQRQVGEWLEPAVSGRGLRVAIVCARFNGAITTRLLAGALDALEEAGVDRANLSIGWVPGAFEIPLLALAYADGAHPYDAVITLGAVIRGETGHYELVAGECARGVQDVQLALACPSSSACSRPTPSNRRSSARVPTSRTRVARRPAALSKW